MSLFDSINEIVSYCFTPQAMDKKEQHKRFLAGVAGLVAAVAMKGLGYASTKESVILGCVSASFSLSGVTRMPIFLAPAIAVVALKAYKNSSVHFNFNLDVNRLLGL